MPATTEAEQPVSQSDANAVATKLVDEWVDAWNAGDVGAILAVFTENATYHDEDGETWTGHDELSAHARKYLVTVSNARRTGEATRTETGSFIFPISFDWTYGTDAGEIEIELDAGLISRLEWLSLTLVG